MTGRQFVDAAESGQRVGGPEEAHILVHRVEIYLALNPWYSEERLYLRSERKSGRAFRIVKRFYAEPVASKKERFVPFVPYCEGEHSIQPRKAIDAPFAISIDYDLGVALGAESVSQGL